MEKNTHKSKAMLSLYNTTATFYQSTNRFSNLIDENKLPFIQVDL